MTSWRPYLLRALYDWISDNDLTPHIVVDARIPGVRVPRQTIQPDGRVTLNIADRAVANLVLGDADILFDARFGGVSQQVRVPVNAVQAIYARENGQGMGLPDDPAPPAQSGDAPATAGDPAADDQGTGDPGPPDDPQPPRPRGGHLRVVK